MIAPADGLLDKVPPHSEEAEKAVLGALIIRTSDAEAVMKMIGPGDFYFAEFGTLFRHICDLWNDKGYIDSALLISRMKERGDYTEQTAALVAEAAKSATVIHVLDYAEEIRDKSQRRRLIQAGARIADSAYNGKSTGELVTQARSLLDEIEVHGEEQDAPAFTRLISCSELLAMDLRPRFLIKNVLVAGQAGCIGGASKVLKTSIGVDLAISLGTGTPFLGQYDAERCRVAFWSGESGLATLRETAQRVAEAKGVDLDGCNVLWGPTLPKLGDNGDVAALRNLIDAEGLHVVIVDPLYRSLHTTTSAAQAGNVMFLGPWLDPLTAVIQDTGCTIIVCHHFRKTGLSDFETPPELEDLSQSGIAEWVRQWLLLKRRAAYEDDGHHALWMRAGGSAAFASLTALDIDEGLIDPDTFSGRHWEISTSSANEAKVQARQDRERRKAKAQEDREGEHVDRLVKAMGQYPKGETKHTLKDASGLNTQALGQAIATIIQNGRIEECSVKKSTGSYPGYKLVEGRK